RDDDDEVYRTAREKNLAIIEDIADTHRRGQPLLVGTVSIEKSEQLARMLSDKDIYRDVAAMVRERLKQTPDKETELRADLQARAEHLDKLATRKAPIPHQVLNARYHEQEAR
ncbi:MAG TPA: preprotein translocase subunit SecA, partial [Hyphomonadaceae bacterium]|nr:preprotein translocase subunit SecA [Hyphomonadaceae bacterium]